MKKYVVRYYEIEVPDNMEGTGLENAICSVYTNHDDRQNILKNPDAVAVFISDHYIADTANLVVNYDVQVFDRDPVIEAPYKQVEVPFSEIEKAVGGHSDAFLDLTSDKFGAENFANGDRSMKFLVQMVDSPDAETVRAENELLK